MHKAIWLGLAGAALFSGPATAQERWSQGECDRMAQQCSRGYEGRGYSSASECFTTEATPYCPDQGNTPSDPIGEVSYGNPYSGITRPGVATRIP